MALEVPWSFLHCGIELFLVNTVRKVWVIIWVMPRKATLSYRQAVFNNYSLNLGESSKVFFYQILDWGWGLLVTNIWGSMFWLILSGTISKGGNEVGGYISCFKETRWIEILKRVVCSLSETWSCDIQLISRQQNLEAYYLRYVLL